MESNSYDEWKMPQLKEAVKRRGITVKPNAKREVYIYQLKESDKNKSLNLFNDKKVNNSFDQKNEKIRPQKNNKLTITRYLQLNTVNVSDYFNSGVIYPLALEESEIYKYQNRSYDIFTQFEDRIILSEGIINSFSESEVLLALILKEDEYSEIKGQRIGFVNKPIPISRIKYIYFANASTRSSFLASVKSFPDCYIPDSLCQIITKDINSYSVNLKNIFLPPNQIAFEWQQKLKYYDKFLGLFAFMKNSGLMYAERENQLREIPSTYIGALCELNATTKLPQREDKVFQAVFMPDKPIHFKSEGQRYIYKRTLELIFNDSIFSIDLAISIIDSAVQLPLISNEEKSDLQETVKLFRQWESKIINYQALLEIETIKKHLPILILLYLAKFPNKSQQNSDKQAVRVSIIENQKNLTRSFAEYILAVLGLYYGYKSMIKNDTNLIFQDENFDFIASNIQSIKFKLENYFDFFVIETVFQFVNLGNQVCDDFDFLQDKINADNLNLTNLNTNKFNYIEKPMLLLNKKFVIIERVSPLDYILRIVQEQYPEKLNLQYFLTYFIVEKLGMTKEQLIDIIRQNVNQISLDELKKIISLDKGRL